VYETRTHGSVRGMMLDMIIQHHPTRLWVYSKLRGYPEAEASGERV